MAAEFFWTIIGTQIATWVSLLLFVKSENRDLRRELREQLDGQGRMLAARLDALTARFDAHLEHHAT